MKQLMEGSLPKKENSKVQSNAFIEAARELGCDEDEAHFNATLKKVAQHKPPPEAVKTKPETKKPAK